MENTAVSSRADLVMQIPEASRAVRSNGKPGDFSRILKKALNSGGASVPAKNNSDREDVPDDLVQAVTAAFIPPAIVPIRLETADIPVMTDDGMAGPISSIPLFAGDIPSAIFPFAQEQNSGVPSAKAMAQEFVTGAAQPRMGALPADMRQEAGVPVDSGKPPGIEETIYPDNRQPIEARPGIFRNVTHMALYHAMAQAQPPPERQRDVAEDTEISPPPARNGSVNFVQAAPSEQPAQTPEIKPAAKQQGVDGPNIGLIPFEPMPARSGAAETAQRAPAPLVSVPDEIARFAATVKSDGEYTLVMKLQPEGLGQLQIKLVSQGGKISLLMMADNTAVKDVLAAESVKLRDAFDSHSLNLSQLDIGFNGGQGGQDLDSMWQKAKDNADRIIAVRKAGQGFAASLSEARLA